MTLVLYLRMLEKRAIAVSFVCSKITIYCTYIHAKIYPKTEFPSDLPIILKIPSAALYMCTLANFCKNQLYTCIYIIISV